MILTVTEILIFGPFIITVGRIFQSRVEHYTRAKVLVAKELVREKIQPEPQGYPDENEAVRNLIQFLGETYDAKVWLPSTDGTPVVQFFPGTFTDEIIHIVKREGVYPANIIDYRHFKKEWTSNSVIPVGIGQDQTGRLRIIFETV